MQSKSSPPGNVASSAAPSGQTGALAAPPANGKRRRIMGLLLAVLLLGLAAWAALWFFVLRFEEATDDAYVAGNVVRITSQVPGRVLEVLADDTDRVKAGQVLVRLDPDDAALALERAVVELASVTRDVGRLQAQERESVALVQAAEVSLEQSLANLSRREALGRANAVRVEELHDYRALVKSATAQLEAARQRQQALEAQLMDAPVQEQPAVLQAAARVRECWLALERTAVRSPVSGQVAQRSVQPGVMVAPGAPLMAVIPLDALWIDANFKEVQLRQMRVGQPAKITVDLHGGSVVYEGRVAGVSAGTGSAFALIPPQNATGNWIKIVQRVPVRIEFSGETAHTHPLLIGLSALVTVDIRDTTGPLLRDNPRQRPLPPVLTAQGITPDMSPIEERIRRTIAENSAPAE